MAQRLITNDSGNYKNMKETAGSDGLVNGVVANKNINKGSGYRDGKPETMAMGQGKGEPGTHSFEHQSKSLKLHTHNKPKAAEGY